MGDVKIRYYVTRKAWAGSRATWGYWVPSKKMQAAGFEIVSCGVDGPLAWARAEMWNKRWDEVKTQLRRGEPTINPRKLQRVYPPGSLGEAWIKFRKTEAWASKKPRTREGWERGWKHIDPVFGDVDLNTIGLEDMDLWYQGDPNDANLKGLLGTVGIVEAYQAMKIWRALWNVAASLKRENGERYCTGKDPSLGIRRKTPKPRQAIWFEGEAVRLVKQSWRMGYRGLAAALAVAWDTMLSPVDVRGLTLSQLTPDPRGPLFSLERAKTGKAAIGTLSRRAEKLLAVYIAGLPFTLHPETPIFHTRGSQPGPNGGRPRAPAPYSKDTLGDDFRDVRKALFPDDKRVILDFRRSGAVEATAGRVDPAALAGKMANTIDTNRELQETYQPHNATLVRFADEARVRGRTLLRGTGGPNTKGSKS